MGNSLRWFLQRLRRHPGAKVLALTLATICWYAVRAVINYETVVSDVPLSIRLDEGWAIMDRSAKTVDITFRGAQEDIAELRRRQVQIDLDLRGQSFSNAAVFALKPEMVQAPGSARPVLVRPETVTLRIDRQGEKFIPVKADTQGALADGEVEHIVCTPAAVRVYGPLQRLTELDVLHTAPIDLEGRRSSFKKLRVPVLAPSDTWVAQLNPADVAVEVFVAEHVLSREWREVPLGLLRRPGTLAELTAWPDKVQVTLRGRKELLDALGAQQLEVFVDCTQLKPGADYELPVRVLPPPGLEVVQVAPRTVKVTVVER